MGLSNINDINPKLDGLLDCGSNTMLINPHLKYLISNYNKVREFLILANNAHIDIEGRGSLGIFSKVAVVNSLTTSLISTKVLCYQPFSFIVLHIDEIAYIIDRYINPQSGRAVITTASIRSDGLYHMDNLLELIYYPYLTVDKSNDYSSIFVALYGPAHVSAYNGAVTTTGVTTSEELEEKRLQRLHLQGSCQSNKNPACEVGLDPLTITHVKFAHMSPKILLWASRHNTTIGMKFCHDQLRRTKLKL